MGAGTMISGYCFPTITPTTHTLGYRVTALMIELKASAGY